MKKKEDILSFLKTWNNNITKINGYNHTYSSLANFCISSCKKASKKFSLEELIIELNKAKEEDKEEIKSVKLLEEALHFEYHCEKTKNESKNRKIIYKGQLNRGHEVIFNRDISIINDKIQIKKITQKEIDLSIMKEYALEKDTNDLDWLSSAYNEKEQFIFYQISLYNNNPNRISKWLNLLKEMTNNHNDINIKDLYFLSNLYVFFKEYNKLETEQDRLELWFVKLKQNEKFKFFMKYFSKKNLNSFNENFIKLYKDDYFIKLDYEFNINLKKSINKTDFLKIQIKEYKSLLNKPSDGTREYRGVSNHNDVYQDLIKGKREDYYNNTRLAKLAGETEAIVDFIVFLEGLKITKNNKSSVKSDNNTQLALLPIEIFENSRGYIKKNASQVNICYKYKAYDACFVLLRKITETLIIEFYEKEEIESKIKDDDGNYFMLKKLIFSFQNEHKFKKFNSRSVREILPRIKKNGDLSAHKRKFNARKLDVDRLRDDYRILFEEFIHSIY